MNHTARLYPIIASFGSDCIWFHTSGLLTTGISATGAYGYCSIWSNEIMQGLTIEHLYLFRVIQVSLRNTMTTHTAVLHCVCALCISSGIYMLENSSIQWGSTQHINIFFLFNIFSVQQLTWNLDRCADSIKTAQIKKSQHSKPWKVQYKVNYLCVMWPNFGNIQIWWLVEQWVHFLCLSMWVQIQRACHVEEKPHPAAAQPHPNRD